MKEKDHWFHANTSEDCGWEEKKELWDGKRFLQLSWFWDPDQKWTLPTFAQTKGVNMSFLPQKWRMNLLFQAQD